MIENNYSWDYVKRKLQENLERNQNKEQNDKKFSKPDLKDKNNKSFPGKQA
ncbi:MAG: hypothetical protein GY714_32645 [Desulfobacterales bacterium]|nr:hypothetical protein [Desulfobacterales bacterium]MCP4160080.1 hypothetical protein [Deltaproteobacteria bacterium]